MKDIDIAIAITVTTLIILILIAIVIISIFIANRRFIKQKIEFVEVQLNYEKELRQAEIEISESMMGRFAEELHDNIGHVLTCMRITIENKKLDQPQFNEIFQPIEVYLNEASQQLQLLSRSLNTDYVTNVGLYAAIELEVTRLVQLRRQHIYWEKGNIEMNIDKNQELMAFRIFQEMIHNSIKHSKAKNLTILLNMTQGFEIVVFDDGRGFDVEQTLQSSKASGLKNMIKRAKMADMACLIESTHNNGCRYTLRKIKNNFS